MSSNYVFMKAANTEPTGKRLNWTASLKVRDMTITVWTLNLTAPVQLRRVRASYSFIFKCYYALLVASTAAALTERRFWFGLGCGKEKNGVLELLVNTEKGASLHLWTFLSLLSSRLLFFCLHRHGWQLHMRATDCTKKISLHRGCRCPVISVCVWFFFYYLAQWSSGGSRSTDPLCPPLEWDIHVRQRWTSPPLWKWAQTRLWSSFFFMQY